MNDGSWLREALTRAAATPPAPVDRAAGAFGIARRRRRNKLVAASCTAVVAVFAATAITGSGAATSGLQPTDSVASTPATPGVPVRSGDARPGSIPGSPVPPAPGTGVAPDSVGAPAGTDAGPGGGRDGAPAAQAPFEVYFLVDATADMHGADAAVRDAVGDVVARLGTRTRLRVGYATFRDWDLSVDAVMGDHLYDRLAPVGLRAGRMPQITYRGGGDIPEGHTFALDAALGHEHVPYTRDPDPAGFSPGARKLVVLVSSSAAKQGGDYPAVDDVVARLNAAGVGVAALHVVQREGSFQTGEARESLREFATGTRATARRGVDCDGDLRVDLRRGSPLVCEVRAGTYGSFAGFADALVERFA